MEETNQGLNFQMNVPIEKYVKPLRMDDGGYLPFLPRPNWNHVKCTGLERHRVIKDIRITLTGTDTCLSVRECSAAAKEIFNQSINEGYADIKYNFLVGRTGLIVEGTGFQYKPVKDTTDPRHSDQITIGILGHLARTQDVTKTSLISALNLVKYGMTHSLISPSYNIRTNKDALIHLQQGLFNNRKQQNQ